MLLWRVSLVVGKFKVCVRNYSFLWLHLFEFFLWIRNYTQLGYGTTSIRHLSRVITLSSWVSSLQQLVNPSTPLSQRCFSATWWIQNQFLVKQITEKVYPQWAETFSYFLLLQGWIHIKDQILQLAVSSSVD